MTCNYEKTLYVASMNPELEKKLIGKLSKASELLLAVLEELQSEDQIIPPEIQQRFNQFEKARLCLHCGKSLGSELVTRGCHRTCYSTLMQRISRGQATERDLLHEGRMQPAGKGGRRSVPLPPLPSLASDEEFGDPETPSARQAISDAADTVERMSSKTQKKPKKSSK